jgi:hypothetical protein
MDIQTLTGGQRPAVGAEGDTIGLVVSGQRGAERGGRHVPELNPPLAGHRQELAAGEKATWYGRLPGQARVARSRPVATSQSLAVPSQSPEASSVPSGLKARVKTVSTSGCRCPVSSRRTFPVARPQRRTTLSVPPEASVFPSGLSQGVITPNGQDHYCGKWPAELTDPPAEVLAADRHVAEWLAAGRRLSSERKGQEEADYGLAVAELIRAFWPHVEEHSRGARGKPTEEVVAYPLSLRHLSADLPVREVPPLKLEGVRELVVNG